MDYAALRAEIALSKYGGMTDAQIATAVTAETVTTAQDVAISAVGGYMLARGIIAKADAWAAANPADTSGVLVAIRSLEGLMASPHLTVVEMSNPDIAAAVQQMIGGMAAAGIMTSAQQTEILAMAQINTTRAAQLGLDTDIHDIEQEIAAARIWPGVAT